MEATFKSMLEPHPQFADDVAALTHSELLAVHVKHLRALAMAYAAMGTLFAATAVSTTWVLLIGAVLLWVALQMTEDLNAIVRDRATAVHVITCALLALVITLPDILALPLGAVGIACGFAAGRIERKQKAIVERLLTSGRNSVSNIDDAG